MSIRYTDIYRAKGTYLCRQEALMEDCTKSEMNQTFTQNLCEQLKRVPLLNLVEKIFFEVFLFEGLNWPTYPYFNEHHPKYKRCFLRVRKDEIILNKLLV